MRAVLILCVIIAAAVACPLIKKKNCSINLPKICPSGWKIKTFESQGKTLLFQGKWNLQLTTPTYVDNQNALKTGLFCNSYPCTHNQLIFRDTTPLNSKDHNIEFEMIDSSYNMEEHCTEIQKALLCPAYGSSSPLAIFNVGSENYYKNPLVEQCPFVDENLFRHKIGQGSCQREYTIAVIGGDDCWQEYMVIVVINKYDNIFTGNDNIIWVLTRTEDPDWCTYQKAYDDIKNSGLSPYCLVSVDHSVVPISGPSIPSVTSVHSLGPITTDDIDGVVKQTSVSSTSATKSIVSDCGSSSLTSTSSSTTTTTTKSTVIIEKSTDFSSPYQVAPCNLFPTYKGLQILKGLDNKTIRRMFSGRYFMQHASPCSFSDIPGARPGLLNTAFPSCSIEMSFDDISMDEWDFRSNHMVMERGYDMMTGKLCETKSFITSVFNNDHEFHSSIFSIYSEGYYKKPIVEKTRLTIDGMICKQPSDIYNTQIIITVLGYKNDDYMILGITNEYNNLLIKNKEVPLIFSYTRERIPSQTTLNSITQEILRCGFIPNLMVKIDHSKIINDLYTFDKSNYESKVTSSIMTKSMVSTRGLGIANKSPTCELPSICPKEWKVKMFDSQLSTKTFQGVWNLQMTTPTYMNGNNPLKTGLFCNSYPCTKNQLIFTDTTPCDNTDFNIEYVMKDSSFNMDTRRTEIQTALLCPAYGNSCPFAIFNVGSENYYDTTLSEKYPFIDKNLFRHKIGQGSCQREYTIAVIGADDCWQEYMVIVVINRYDNIFQGNDNIIWVVTRTENPDWCTYQKAYDDIINSGLSPYCLVSVDHSVVPISVPSIPSVTSVPSLGPITTDDIDGVVKQTSVSSTSATKSIVSDCGSSSLTSTSSSTTTTTTKSTVIIEKSTDFSSSYQFAPCDLFPTYKGLQILKGLDNKTIRRMFSGRYFMQQATPCSFYNSPNSKFGLLNTAFPSGSIEMSFDDISMDEWDFQSNHMMMERGYDMRTGKLCETKSFITSVFNNDHEFHSSIFSIYSEGYYEKPIVEKTRLTIDGMICKQPSDIYNTQIIITVLGYKNDDYMILGVANNYNNPLFSTEKVHHVYTFTRERIPNLDTMKSITQSLLYCGCNPNKLMKVDHSRPIDEPYVFDRSYYESQTSCWSSISSSSGSSCSSSSTTFSSSSSSVSISCD